MNDTKDPIHLNEDGKWYFWTEDWANEVGPFETSEIARLSLDSYNKHYLGSRPNGNTYALTFNELRGKNAKRCVESFHPIEDWSPTDWGCAMAGEAGEACNLIKKLRRLDSVPDGPKKTLQRIDLVKRIGDELADMVIYADLEATRLGLNLGTCVVDKFNEDSDSDDVKSSVKL